MRVRSPEKEWAEDEEEEEEEEGAFDGSRVHFLLRWRKKTAARTADLCKVNYGRGKLLEVEI